MSEFGHYLQYLRKLHGWTQEKLGNQVGAVRNTISNWERGGSPPPNRNIVLLLAQKLECTPEEADQLLLTAGYHPKHQINAHRSADLIKDNIPRKLKDIAHPHKENGLTRLATRCDFYASAYRPRTYIERTQVLTDVRKILLSPALPPECISEAQHHRPIALHGIGGIGKSVIARAICDDSEVQAAFPDGILWLTLGKAPDLVSAMRSWINALGGVISENAPTVQALQNILVTLLRERACLLILDDVWRYTHAQMFLVDSPRSRLLLTIRDDIIARELGATVQQLPLMTNEEAIALLEQSANGHLAETVPDLKKQIVERLGCLPLAVKLAGAQLQWKPADIWLQTFDVRTLESPRLETLHDSLERTIRLSLDELKEHDLWLYVALAIFQENEPIPQTAIEHLWRGLAGLDRYATQYLLKDLAARALLDIISHPSLYTPAVQLHNLLHDLIRMELGESSIATHQTLLATYRATQEGIGWHTAPNDGYLYDHLVYHLQAANAEGELKELFTSQNWMHVRVPQCHHTYDGYLEDLSLAWKSADAKTRKQIKENKEPIAFADCMRYLMIRTSINGVAGNYIPELVARAVEVGLWSLDRALSVAAKISNTWKQAYMYIVLLQRGNLRESQQEDVSLLALRATLSIVDKNMNIRDLLNGKGRALALAMLAPHLKGELLEQGLEATLALAHGFQRILALMALAPQLADGQVERVLEVIQALPDILQRALMLSTFASHMSKERRTEMVRIEMEAAFTLTDKLKRAQALATLAPCLSTEQRFQTLKQELDVTFALTDEQQQAQILVKLAPQLTGKLLEQALKATLVFTNEWHRMEVLIALAPLLTDELLEQALHIALTIKSEMERTRTLRALAPRLTGQLVEQALQAILAVTMFYVDRVEAIAELAPRIPSMRRSQVLQQELEFAQSLTLEEFTRAHLLAKLAPHLSGELLEQALGSALALRDVSEREWLLPFFAPQLSGKLLERALAHAFISSDEWRRVKFLAMLAAQLPVEQRTQVLKQELDAILTVAYERGRVHFLAVLAPWLSTEQRTPILRQELDAAIALTDKEQRAQSLATLAPLLPSEQKAQILEIATKLIDERNQAQILAALAPWLSTEQQAQVLGIALGFTSEVDQATVLVSLAPHLSGELLEQGLETTLALTYDPDRMRTLQALAPQLSVKQRAQALDRELPALQTQTDITRIDNILTSLVCLLPQELHQQWLDIAITIAVEQQRTSLLAALAPQLMGKLVERALEAALALRDEEQRGQVLVALAPQLTGKLVPRALEAALALRDEEQCGRVLVALAPQLKEELLEQGVKAASVLTDARIRAYALATFFPLVSNQIPLQQSIQLAMTDYLLRVKHWSREDIFKDELIRGLFKQSLLSSEVICDITLHIIEICQGWHWQ